ncbi:MAG: hypothetical protein ACJAZN_000458 [Planctomycetota bacterium]|jgi:hypothetical protein
MAVRVAVCTSALASQALAQSNPELTYSIDFSGPTINALGNAAGNRVTEADLLIRSGSPFAPGPPRIGLLGDYLFRYQACAGHIPGVACGVEINAISFGRDARLQSLLGYRFHVLFSVDEFAVGRPDAAGTPFTDVFQEAGGREAAGDMFLSTFQGPAPFNASPNFAYADGDGARVTQGSSHVFGLGLVEPIIPNTSSTDSGDNIDAINYGTEFVLGQDVLFFSLESDMVRCGGEGGLFNSADAQPIANSTTNARASDVLLVQPGTGSAPVFRYASGQELGLDLEGVGTDDIDAVMVVENGQPGYQAPSSLYEWESANPSDLILFSVRCGSEVVGEIDLVTNRIIGEGDILIKLANTQGPPQVFIPAEALGLRSLFAGDLENDELNGLDIFDDAEEPFKDCNMNGIDDGVDISYMNSNDLDNNGIPDECEDDWSVFCGCGLASDSPCGNTTAAGRGCLNAAMLGGKLDGAGTTSVDTDALQLVVTDLVPGTYGFAFAGVSTTSLPVQSGRLCVVPTGRLGGAHGAPAGALSLGPGLIGMFPGILNLMSGSTFYFQVYYRDIGGPCDTPSNFSPGNYTNALQVTFTP